MLQQFGGDGACGGFFQCGGYGGFCKCRLAGDLRGERFVRGDELFQKVGLVRECAFAGGEERDEGVVLRDESLGFGVEFQARNPRLDGPHGVQFFALEEVELVGVLRGDDEGVAAARRDVQPARFQPSAGGYVLRVAELWSRDFFPAKIGGRFQSAAGLDDERDAAPCSSGEHADVRAFGADVAVQHRIRADVSGVNGAREQCFDGARACVERQPFDACARGFFKDALRAFGERFVVGDECLCVRDIGEEANPQHGLAGRGYVFFPAACKQDDECGGSDKGTTIHCVFLCAPAAVWLPPLRGLF